MLSKLTPREQEVARLVASGRRSWEIAEQLGICEGRVKNLVSTIFDKTGLTNRTELALALYRKGEDPRQQVLSFG